MASESIAHSGLRNNKLLNISRPVEPQMAIAHCYRNFKCHICSEISLETRFSLIYFQKCIEAPLLSSIEKWKELQFSGPEQWLRNFIMASCTWRTNPSVNRLPFLLVGHTSSIARVQIVKKTWKPPLISTLGALFWEHHLLIWLIGRNQGWM